MAPGQRQNCRSVCSPITRPADQRRGTGPIAPGSIAACGATPIAHAARTASRCLGSREWPQRPRAVTARHVSAVCGAGLLSVLTCSPLVAESEPVKSRRSIRRTNPCLARPSGAWLTESRTRTSARAGQVAAGEGADAGFRGKKPAPYRRRGRADGAPDMTAVAPAHARQANLRCTRRPKRSNRCANARLPSKSLAALAVRDARAAAPTRARQANPPPHARPQTPQPPRQRTPAKQIPRPTRRPATTQPLRQLAPAKRPPAALAAPNATTAALMPARQANPPPRSPRRKRRNHRADPGPPSGPKRADRFRDIATAAPPCVCQADPARGVGADLQPAHVRRRRNSGEIETPSLRESRRRVGRRIPCCSR